MLALSPEPGSLRHLLVIGAHPDDIEIGCGGTVLLLGDRHPDLAVTWVVVTGTPERQAEARTAVGMFLPHHDVEIVQGSLPDGRLPAFWKDTKELLEGVADSQPVDIILGPSRSDSHQDHRTVAEIVPTVWRDALVLEYEIPKLDGDLVRRNAYVPLSEEHVRRKCELLDKAFPSQHGRQWWDHELFAGLARLRGIECRQRYAEAFQADKVAFTW